MRCRSIFYFVMIITATCAKVQTKEFWFKTAQFELNRTLSQVRNTNVAKNLVMVVGDGMGVTTATAARIYRGQQELDTIGEEEYLSWDTLPSIGLVKTYTANAMTADSAASATALHTGAKTKNGVIGLDVNVIPGNCFSTARADSLTSIAQWARADGKSVGIVTTDRLSGATPAPLYAKAANRAWQDDADLPVIARGICKDIAVQMLNEENLNIQILQVWLGGGRDQMLPKTADDPEYNRNGSRLDGRNLAEEWVIKQREKGRTAKYVYDLAGFNNATDVDYLLGVFEPGRMQEEYVRRTKPVPIDEPSIAEMVEKAVEILSKNPNGFYLFIEGANIDIGHHKNRAHMALEETLALNDAVQNVLDMTSPNDTLLVVTADHSHEFSFGGYSLRGENILGLVKNPGSQADSNGKPFTVVAYGNGPGQRNPTELKNENYNDNTDTVYVAAVPLRSATHGAEDVPVFASGPMSHLFTGVHEQNYLPHAMAYAACIGENKDHCNSK